MYISIDIVQKNFPSKKKEGTKLTNLMKRVPILRKQGFLISKNARTKREQYFISSMLLNKKCSKIKKVDSYDKYVQI